jgi:hypothetical protein
VVVLHAVLVAASESVQVKGLLEESRSDWELEGTLDWGEEEKLTEEGHWGTGSKTVQCTMDHPRPFWPELDDY